MLLLLRGYVGKERKENRKAIRSKLAPFSTAIVRRWYPNNHPYYRKGKISVTIVYCLPSRLESCILRNTTLQAWYEEEYNRFSRDTRSMWVCGRMVQSRGTLFVGMSHHTYLRTEERSFFLLRFLFTFLTLNLGLFTFLMFVLLQKRKARRRVNKSENSCFAYIVYIVVLHTDTHRRVMEKLKEFLSAM